MNYPSDWNLSRRCLFDILLPSMVGIFSVTILMSGLYWLALRSLHAAMASETVLYDHLLKRATYYSHLTAVSVAISTILFLLFAIKYVNYLHRPMQLASELESYLPSAEQQTLITKGKGFVFKKLRERAIILVSASMGAPFLLLGGLYLAVISMIYKFGQLSFRELNLLIRVFSYYGSLVLCILVICNISLICWSFYRLKKSLHLESVPPDVLEKIMNNCPGNYTQLEKQIETLLLFMDIKADDNEQPVADGHGR